MAAFRAAWQGNLRSTLGKNLLCIAGGSGIAGRMAILSRAATSGYFERHRAWVFFGVRTMRDAFFLDELSAYTLGVEVTVALSEEQAPVAGQWPRLRFAQGLVHEVAKRAMAGKYANVRAYVAGPPPAVDAAIRVLLLEAQLTTDNIRYDKYS
jgi:toluene monooxygenase electron transfer component